MNALNPKEQELVALGASLGSNCAPCVAYHIEAGRKAGLTDHQIAHAIQLAERVRQVPARGALDAARRALPGNELAAVCDSDAGASLCCQ